MALAGHEWTLTEAARSLGAPQHRLIYLCEKGVVQPDLEDARDRGSSRRFSARNLLEFAVALRLRELELPASLIGAVTYTLRAFERKVQDRIRTFRLPDSLRGPAAPDLRVLISDGRLYLSLGTGKDVPKVYGGIELRKFAFVVSGVYLWLSAQARSWWAWGSLAAGVVCFAALWMVFR